MNHPSGKSGGRFVVSGLLEKIDLPTCAQNTKNNKLARVPGKP